MTPPGNRLELPARTEGTLKADNSNRLESGLDAASWSLWHATPLNDALLSKWLPCTAAFVAVGLLYWSAIFPNSADVPPVAEIQSAPAELQVQRMRIGGVWREPTWEELFKAYQLETSLRDISIRRTYQLSPDTDLNGRLTQTLQVGSTVDVYLSDPGN